MIENQNKLTKFALKYTLRTRAILGAIFKEIGNKNCAYELKLTLNPMTNYKLKQSKCPNNPRKKIYKKIVGSKNRRIERDWIKNESWENEIPTHKLSKSILWEIV